MTLKAQALDIMQELAYGGLNWKADEVFMDDGSESGLTTLQWIEGELKKAFEAGQAAALEASGKQSVLELEAA